MSRIRDVMDPEEEEYADDYGGGSGGGRKRSRSEIIDDRAEEDEMSIRSMNKQRVPVFVLMFPDEDTMEFYAFHESTWCPTFDPTTRLPVADFVAKPFTGFIHFPEGVSFASVGDQFYLVGGPKLSLPQMRQRDELLYGTSDTDLLLDPIDDGDMLLDDKIDDVHSCRVKRFGFQRFVDSSADNRHKGKMNFVELDDNEVSNGYWETCEPLSIGRTQASLLHLRGKLYAVGGIVFFDEKLDLKASLIEVFDEGVWTPLTTQDPPDIDPYRLIAVALEDTNTILIGSKGAFYELNVGTTRWKELVGVKCPDELVQIGLEKPGFVVHNTYVLWYDRMYDDENALCIRGLDFRANKHFRVDILKDLVDLEYKYNYNAQTAQLISVGDKEGSLCLIYYKPTYNLALDDHGDQCVLCEYHCVTFQIIFDNLAVENIPFPGVQLETKVISRRKCFARNGEYLCAAFPMDVYFPQEKNPLQQL